MKKTMLFILCICALSILFVGCSCQHEWKDANCTSAKTCSLCNATEGAPLGHNWNAATCEAPKTCQVCKTTEGQALGHKWVEADCENPKKCETCKETEGTALGHVWQDATTETPKTCATCEKTEGEKITTDSRFTTSACQDFFGKWVGDMVVSGDMLGELVPGMDLSGMEMLLHYEMIFNNDGTGTMTVAIDPYSLEETFRSIMTEMLLAPYLAQGMTREEAAAAFQTENFMTIEQVVELSMGQLDEMETEVEEDFVYYVADGMLYMGMDWDEELEGSEYTMEIPVLTLTANAEDLGLPIGEIQLVLNKVKPNGK